ncbi:FAD-dependent oxidoreductase [Caballeronia sp. LZ035]|uniref:FAD-dependent oxidoreductase n=1 Tax=Caballeronia sp. LZ035 TaxID=3038568 RepID=UPI0028614584|nr:FAD-dependent oxidoreductase [Caballeronia sp. LZ035]MDR5760606.1 FAD-binding protein [Caballeronia sp. LZ035]
MDIPLSAAQYDDVYDVVVVGYGAAGAVAAIEAADAGARVLLVEKMRSPGGITLVSAGGVRIAFDRDAAWQYLNETCGQRTPAAVLDALADGMVALPDYLRTLALTDDAGITVSRAPGNYPWRGYDALGYASVAHIPGFDVDTPYLAARPFCGGCLLFRLLADNVERAGVTVWLDSPVERLIVDARGAVTGVQVRRNASDPQTDSPSLAVAATRGVILACGGFESDARQLRDSAQSQALKSGSFRGNTGDGIRMAQRAGAALWHMWHLHGPYGFRHPDPDYPFGIYVKQLPMWTPGHETPALPKMAWIVVDQLGARYANEYPPYLSDTAVRQFDHFDADRARHTRLPSFLLFDEAGRTLYPMGRSITNDEEAHYAWSADNLAEVANGILVRADTLDELARALDLDPRALRATVERWNAGCAAGRDDDFGRRPETMMPLSTPPFYGARLWPIVINTQGGPVHDAEQRVLDPYDTPIPNLYAAGELGSVFGHVYMAGGNLAECIVGGRTAARSALGLSAVWRAPAPCEETP